MLIQSFVRFFVKTRLTEFILEMIQLVILEFFSFPEILFYFFQAIDCNLPELSELPDVELFVFLTVRFLVKMIALCGHVFLTDFKNADIKGTVNERSEWIDLSIRKPFWYLNGPLPCALMLQSINPIA